MTAKITRHREHSAMIFWRTSVISLSALDHVVSDVFAKTGTINKIQIIHKRLTTLIVVGFLKKLKSLFIIVRRWKVEGKRRSVAECRFSGREGKMIVLSVKC